MDAPGAVSNWNAGEAIEAEWLSLINLQRVELQMLLKEDNRKHLHSRDKAF